MTVEDEFANELVGPTRKRADSPYAEWSMVQFSAAKLL